MTPLVTLASYNPNDVKPGWIAFWIVVALGVATFLLWRSMNTQLRKIKAPYKNDVAAAGGEADRSDPEQSQDDHSDNESDGSRGTA
jgi:hypothetical protein